MEDYATLQCDSLTHTHACLQAHKLSCCAHTSSTLPHTFHKGNHTKACVPRRLDHDFHTVHQVCCTDLNTLIVSERVTHSEALRQYDVVKAQSSSAPLHGSNSGSRATPQATDASNTRDVIESNPTAADVCDVGSDGTESNSTSTSTTTATTTTVTTVATTSVAIDCDGSNGHALRESGDSHAPVSPDDNNSGGGESDDGDDDDANEDDLSKMPWLVKELEEGEFIAAPRAVLANHVHDDDGGSEDDQELADSPWLLEELANAEYIPMDPHLRKSSSGESIADVIAATIAVANTQTEEEDAEELNQSPWLARELAEAEVIPSDSKRGTGHRDTERVGNGHGTPTSNDQSDDDDTELARMPWLVQELQVSSGVPFQDANLLPILINYWLLSSNKRSLSLSLSLSLECAMVHTTSVLSPMRLSHIH